MRRGILVVAGLMIAASLSWTPGAQAATKPLPCLITWFDLSPWGQGVVEVPSGSWLSFSAGQVVKTEAIREEFLAKSVDSLSLDGKALTYGYTYSYVHIEGGSDTSVDPPAVWQTGDYPMVSIEYLFTPLRPGIHTLVLVWDLTDYWTDGWYPLMEPGSGWGGNITIVVTPRDLYPSVQYENLCRTA